MTEEPEYAHLTAPDDRPPTEYTATERRAELYQIIEDAGHPRNMRRSQAELGERYGVSARMISKDIQRLQDYLREKDGDRAISTTKWLGQKAVHEQMEAAREMQTRANELESAGRPDDAMELREQAAGLFRQALETQLQYDGFLFDVGQLEETPDRVSIEGDIESTYMEMLETADEDE